MDVEYREIPSHPDYFAGSDGSIWSHRFRRKKRMWPQVDPGGYFRVRITNLYRLSHWQLVHRLVLEAFAGPCPIGLECRHLDGNPMNNQPENLAWGTRKENFADSVRHGTAAYLQPGFRPPIGNQYQSKSHKQPAE